MRCLADFHSFVALPTELRLMIWEEAFTTPTACIALPEGSSDDVWRLALASAGSTPYRIGLSCKEAWRQMRQMCRRIHYKPVDGKRAGDCMHWLNLDTTVFHFSSKVNPTAVLQSFGADDLRSIRHIALTWDTFDRLARTCQTVARMLPALRSFSTQRGRGKPMGPHTTYLLSGVALCFGERDPPIETSADEDDMDWIYLRMLVLQYLSDTPPKLHFPKPSCFRILA